MEAEKLVDVVSINIDGPCTVASMDLAAAMVMHAASTGVETVNGEIVKKEGVLRRVNWNELNKEFG